VGRKKEKDELAIQEGPSMADQSIYDPVGTIGVSRII